jgi:predicted NAD/FAD-dependent oxidoreductase
MIPFHIPYVISHVDKVVTDRLSALEYRADLGDPSAQGVVQQYRSACQSTSNAASLVLMVAFESSLGLGFDGITFNSDSDSDSDNNSSSSSIGWIARDTSKPGRERSDTKECWVIQSTLTAATTLIDNINSRGNYIL